MGLHPHLTPKLWFQKLDMLPGLPTFAEYASLLEIHFGPIPRTKFKSRNTEIRTVKVEIPLR